jgi:hypothetical protein
MRQAGGESLKSSDIKSKDSYAVFDQVRTVNANRFYPVKSGSSRINVPMDNGTMLKLFELAIRDMIFNAAQDEKISVLKNTYSLERFNKAKDLAYNIIKLRKAGVAADGRIAALKSEIRETLKGVAYTLDAKQAVDGLQEIFGEALS